MGADIGRDSEVPIRFVHTEPGPNGTTSVTYELTVDLTIPMIGLFKRKAEKIITDTALKELKKRVEG
ncbi:hypothetical protein GCM10020255_088650 [Rhodococcus baikonurensis]